MKRLHRRSHRILWSIGVLLLASILIAALSIQNDMPVSAVVHGHADAEASSQPAGSLP